MVVVVIALLLLRFVFVVAALFVVAFAVVGLYIALMVSRSIRACICSFIVVAVVAADKNLYADLSGACVKPQLTHLVAKMQEGALNLCIDAGRPSVLDAADVEELSGF